MNRRTYFFTRKKRHKNLKKKDKQIGIMVEVPSAALMIGHISGYIDFFSIGTNALTHYTLAIDRTKERVADLEARFILL